MKNINSGKACTFCGSYNTFVYNNPLHIRNSILCQYCYTIENLSFKKENKYYKIDAQYLKYLNDYVKTVLVKNNHKDALIFDNDISNENINFGDDINFNIIQDYDSIKNINNILKYSGLLKSVIVPNLNLFNFANFFNQIKDLISPSCTITVGIFRENYYTGRPDKDYHYVYNGFCIEKILNKTEYFVQSYFFYQDNYLILNIAKYEPKNYEIRELETLTSNFIEEDSDPKYIKTF